MRYASDAELTARLELGAKDEADDGLAAIADVDGEGVGEEGATLGTGTIRLWHGFQLYVYKAPSRFQKRTARHDRTRIGGWNKNWLKAKKRCARSKRSLL